MEVVKLIQPHEFGDNFIFEDGKWKVKFPPIPESGVEVSKDANNLITLGGDGGMFADVTRLHAYALVQDNENMKIHLYRHQANIEFDIAQATLINSIDMLELNGQFDDITVTDAIVTFKDVQTDTELVFDTDQFLNVTGLEIQHPLVKNPSGVTNFAEMKISLYRSEIGGGVSFRFTKNGVGYSLSPYWGYYSRHGVQLADALNSYLEEIDLNVEFYTVENTVITDEPFVVRSTIGIRNLDDSPIEMFVSVNDHGPVENTLTGLIFTTAPEFKNIGEGQYSLTLGGKANSLSVVISNSIVGRPNLIKNTPEGLLVLPAEGVHIEHSLEARSYQVDVSEDDIEVDEFVRTINGNEIRIPAVTLKNSRGKTLGAIVAKIPDKLDPYELQ